MITQAYGAAVGVWGVRSKDFWRMHPVEFWTLAEAKIPPKNYGSMTEAEVAQIYNETYGDDDAD